MLAPAPDPSITHDLSQAANALFATCTTGAGNDDVLCATLLNVLPATWASPVAWLISLVLIVIGALIIRALLQRLIERVIRRAADGVMPERLRVRAASGNEGTLAVLTERRRQRAETLGSVLSSLISIVVLGTAALMIIGRFGLDLAPVLTSVGILGVAIGFGAQELVKDFIAGMFMLLEDQYGVGDLIDTGAAVGTVEAVTLRITRLRDADGRVWYVRNGTITRIGNESQGWARALVDVPVAYEADIVGMRELLKKVAEDFWADPAFRETAIVEEPEVYGLEQISDKAMIFRLTVKTVPSQRAEVARELRMRVKWALDQAGIPLAGV
ncbi:mechanosensitive ion channel family protein [Sphaerisporangium sp. TRM90804]|uniref:mechanosensitive ion channel family protein n=1 Tax=Sphaerisporangium sp. TRM90804 TaxID=3031113 RepID=UPI002447F674|nr:mechanosensitive ion channel family protein [Sphaerisporangium sp. TRM90804]MDH2429735.1 mechanosensitive ion channel family protein [Sphaerisporangium sp. TRM90804]